eukprot:6144642-Pleurochrysis_carterae.AAC.1
MGRCGKHLSTHLAVNALAYFAGAQRSLVGLKLLAVNIPSMWMGLSACCKMSRAHVNDTLADA